MNEFLRKKWEMAGLADDYIFNKVMLYYDIEMQVADLHDIAQRKVEATDPLVVKLKERIAVVKRTGNGGRNTCDVQYMKWIKKCARKRFVRVNVGYGMANGRY